MADSTPDREQVRSILSHAEQMDPPESPTRELLTALVRSNLLIAEELKGIREELGFGLGDGSNVDQIAQALRVIAEPEKYGIDPRSLGR